MRSTLSVDMSCVKLDRLIPANIGYLAEAHTKAQYNIIPLFPLSIIPCHVNNAWRNLEHSEGRRGSRRSQVRVQSCKYVPFIDTILVIRR